MSTDYAWRGIRVNTVSPGTIDSPMLHQFATAQSDPERIRREFEFLACFRYKGNPFHFIFSLILPYLLATHVKCTQS